MQCQPVLFFASIGRESAFRWGARLAMSQAGYFSEFVKGTGVAEFAFRAWEGRNANVLSRPLIHIGYCSLLLLL